jgi:nucleotide-binding universal stress UspA family protein
MARPPAASIPMTSQPGAAPRTRPIPISGAARPVSLSGALSSRRMRGPALSPTSGTSGPGAIPTALAAGPAIRHNAPGTGEAIMRKFLVVLDDSKECLNAMRFAAMRAAHTGGGVQILSIIPPDEFNHWAGVGEIMREEARERITVHFEVFAKWMRDRHGVNPELVIREGEPVKEILAQIRDDPEIGVLVLGAGTDSSGPGPLVTQLSRQSGSLPIPITIVPGNMSKERLEAIT